MEHGLQRSIVNRRAYKRACSPDRAGNHTSRRLLVLCPSSSTSGLVASRESRGVTKTKRRHDFRVVRRFMRVLRSPRLSYACHHRVV